MFTYSFNETFSFDTTVFFFFSLQMFPNFNSLFPSIARQVVNYRFDRKLAAASIAATPGSDYLMPNRSFDGLKYPWMSAFVGIEENPLQTEDHLQGDIALAFLQHFYATGDTQWLAEKGFPVLEGLARFWASRVDALRDGIYQIAATRSPDEYHNNVTNPPYTNTVAKISLRAAYDLAPLVGLKPNETFKRIADGLPLLYDSKLDYHPEFAGYVPSDSIKQADVTMLGYPLGVSMDDSTKRNDLETYARVTDPRGPGMTVRSVFIFFMMISHIFFNSQWSMHSISWGDLGDYEKSDAFFERGYHDYVKGAFSSWYEGYGDFGGVSYFITGVGGWLQSIINGYGGVRYARDSMTINRPRVPPNCTSMKIRGISYLGSKLELNVPLDGNWTLSAPELGSVQLYVHFASGTVVPLTSSSKLSAAKGESVQIMR